MNKKHQRIEDMFETARKSEKAHPRDFQSDSRISGRDRRRPRGNFRVMADIYRRYSNVSFSPNIFTPYPGIPIWPD